MSTIKTLNVKVNGLHANKKYRFNFTNKGGNWPVKVSPLSGIFYPDTVKTYVYFCSTTGECPSGDPNVFFNTPVIEPSTPGLALDNQSLYSILELSVKEFDCDNIITTHPCVVECDECIPNISVHTESISLNSDDGTESTFSFPVSGLVPNQIYKYVLSGAGGNWPVTVTPRSGIIQTSDTSCSINGLISVCQSTEICSSGNANVINYTNIPNNADLLYSVLNLSVEPVDTINSNFQINTTSTFTVECDNCLHRLKVDAEPIINLTGASTGFTTFTTNLTNTIPGRVYTYSVQSIDTNWPVLIYPYSGTMLAASDTESLSFNLRFCDATSLCPTGTNGILPYTLNTSYLIPKQAKFRIKIEDSCADSVSLCSDNWGSSSITYSDEIIAICDDCLIQPSIVNSVNQATITSDNDPTYVLSSTVSNLIPGQSYKYNINYIDSNWPTVVSKQSGMFTAVSSNKLLKTNLKFCYPSGSCLEEADAILAYDNYSDSDQSNKFITINLSIDTIDNSISRVYSNDFTLLCEGCLSMNQLSINFSGAPILNLSNCSCSGSRLALVSTTGAIPYNNYSYLFSSSSNSISFSPTSGTTTFGSSGSGNIMSIMNLSLASGDQSIVQVQLTDNSSNIQATNYLAIKCSGSCG